MGLPTPFVDSLLEGVKSQFGGDFGSESAYEWVQQRVRKENIIKTRAREAILNLYPDC